MLFIEAARESVDMNYKELVAAREEYAKED